MTPALAPALTMAETAAAVGLSYERFRKVWRSLRRLHGFPAPILGRRWEVAAVAGWIAARSAAPPPPPGRGAANDDYERAWRALERSAHRA